MDDVGALRAAAEELGVLVMVESSRSGDGAHVDRVLAAHRGARRTRPRLASVDPGDAATLDRHELQQWARRLSEFLGLEPGAVGSLRTRIERR